eukprot:CAMPEP_0172397932 /NCGR_PEP_ID=MMETSP1061-20121228/33425_1 /TAXON_ID=37318 /ORGANISM="Pseudo-nitzschia pungens, Strain cf. pungens" /LENGTH=750 /DNA_ID=CAMNT_0013130263 /DNA_START=120 /DNA_END=2372 /DNA_ORIENTATION=+
MLPSRQRLGRRVEDAMEGTSMSLGICDESKCVSRGLSHLYNHSFTCYGDNKDFSMMCADGYLPRVVEDEPLVTATVAGGIESSFQYFTCCPPDIPSSEATSFTRLCSDPEWLELSDTASASDPSATDDAAIESSAAVCDEDSTGEFFSPLNRPSIFLHVHPNDFIASNFEGQPYMCCDESASNETAIPVPETESYLQDAECVPYRSELYEEAKVQNFYGNILPITCDFPDGGFQYPRRLPNEGSNNDLPSQWFHYQCCRTGPALQPFIKDYAFNTTVWPAVVLSTLAAMTSLCIILALSIPLLIQLSDGTFQEGQRTTSTGSTSSNRRHSRMPTSVLSQRSKRWSILSNRGSSFQGVGTSSSLAVEDSRMSTGYDPEPVKGKSIDFSNSQALGKDSMRDSNESYPSHASPKPEPAFSTYNLYLIYLAIPDFLMSMYELGMSSSMIHQKFNPNFFSPIIYTKLSMFTHEWAINLGYAISAILYINAFVSHEVLILLRSFTQVQKMKPPTLKKVTMQSLFAFVLAITFSTIDTFIRKVAKRELLGGNKERSDFLLFMTDLYWYVLMFVPIFYIAYVCITIAWRRYLPSIEGNSRRERALKELVWYFVRVIAVIFGIWFPFILLAVWYSKNSPSKNDEWVAALALCVGPIGSLTTTSVILTQKKVREYVWRLLTLSYVRDFIWSRRHGGVNGGEESIDAVDPGVSKISHVAMHASVRERIADLNFNGSQAIPEDDSYYPREKSRTVSFLEPEA